MENKIKEIIVDVLNIKISELKKDSSPDTIENWDSLKHINIIIALETEFNIEFDDEDIINMIDYQCIEQIIKDKIS